MKDEPPPYKDSDTVSVPLILVEESTRLMGQILDGCFDVCNSMLAHSMAGGPPLPDHLAHNISALGLAVESFRLFCKRNGCADPFEQ